MPPPPISWLIGVKPWLPGLLPDIFICLHIASFSLAPHEVDRLLMTGSWLLLFSTSACRADTGCCGLFPVLICLRLNIALRTAAASDWLRARKRALKLLLLVFSAVPSPFAELELELAEKEVSDVLPCWLSPDLLRERLKLLSRPFSPPDPSRVLNSFGLLAGSADTSSSTTSGSGKTARSYKTGNYNLFV